MRNSQKDDDYQVAYPTREQAVAIYGDGRPFSSAVIGITEPYADYKMQRLARDPCSVLEYVESGAGEIYFDGQWQKVCAGDTYIMVAGEDYRYRANADDPWKKYWVNYESDMFSEFLSARGVTTGVYKVDTKPYFQTLWALANAETVNDALRDAIADHVQKIVKAAALSKQDGSAAVAREYLDASVYKKVDLDEAAAALFVSKSNLIRLFKKAYGVTPYEYVLSVKLETAGLLLKNTQMQVKEIAERLHITDEHYFSTLFRRRFGVSPRAFRKQ